MKTKTVILGIDIQNDFTVPEGSLYVKDSNKDVERMSTFIQRNSAQIDHIILTADSHQPIHIASPVYWKNQAGNFPDLFTIISAQEVEEGKWIPQYNQNKAVDYLKELEKKKEVCTIWPPHCILGSKGWAINEILLDSIYAWCIQEGKSYEILLKGIHQATEHYSIFKAAVEFEDCKETQLNTNLLRKLMTFDQIIIIGEAGDYCVANSLKDILLYAPEIAKKTVILTDCMSWIQPDNPTANNIYSEAKNVGVIFSTSTEYSF